MTDTKQPEALRLAKVNEFLAEQTRQDKKRSIMVRLFDDNAKELRRLHEVNLGLIELAEALNDALTEVCSRNANLEISDKHDERIKVASAKLKEQK
jgi:hypothetical protein